MVKYYISILKYVEYLLVLISKFTGWVSIYAFASLVCVDIGITNSAVGIKTCAITGRIKKYRSIIKRHNKKHDKIVFLGKR